MDRGSETVKEPQVPLTSDLAFSNTNDPATCRIDIKRSPRRLATMGAMLRSDIRLLVLVIRAGTGAENSSINVY